MSIPRYSAYAPVRADFLHELPDGWQLRSLKSVAMVPIRNGVGEAGAFDNAEWPRYVRITDIASPRRLREDTFASLPPDIAKDAELLAGDLLMAAVGASFGKSYLHRFSPHQTCYAGFLVRFRASSDVIPEFASFWTESEHYWSQVRSRVIQSTIQNFSASRYGTLSIVLPPIANQRGIVAFLERETAKIDALIAEQERLIALLQEKRLTVISHAVTKGLDPNVPMKDSEVEWVGKIPAHWNTVSIGLLLKEHPRYGVLVPDSVDVGVPMLRITDIEGDQADREGLAVISESLSNQYSRTIVSSGDVVLSVVGTLGKALVVRVELAGVNLSRALARLIPGPDIDAEYLRLYLTSHSFSHFIDLVCTGSAQKVLNMDDLRAHRMPLPPMGEQRRIASAASSRAHSILELESEASRALSLLRERRTALITAAVTGQIDVRGFAETAA